VSSSKSWSSGRPAYQICLFCRAHLGRRVRPCRRAFPGLWANLGCWAYLDHQAVAPICVVGSSWSSISSRSSGRPIVSSVRVIEPVRFVKPVCVVGPVPVVRPVYFVGHLSPRVRPCSRARPGHRASSGCWA